MQTLNNLISILLALLLLSCGDDFGNKGSLTLSITDSPADADKVKGVNIFISSIDGRIGSQWKSLKNFDQPVGVNLLDYSGGNSHQLVDQYLDPGHYESIRFRLNLADLNSSLILSPQCNVLWADGTTHPIYFYQAGVFEIILNGNLTVNSQSRADFTFDFDVRKSIVLDSAGRYILNPVIRTIPTTLAGHIQADVSNYNPTDRIVVFIYPAGQYTPSEASAPSATGVRFPNAITASRIIKNKFALGFLLSGSYDLVFARHNAAGEFVSVAGRFDGVNVSAPEILKLTIDLSQLSGS